VPWMPEVFTAPIADARREQGAASANDAVPYYEGILANQPEALVRSFAGEPRVNDPRVGFVEGPGSYAHSSTGRRTGCASATRWWRTWP
jgi:hypothetical protein